MCGTLGSDEGMSDFILRSTSKPTIERLQKLSLPPPPRIGWMVSRLQVSLREEIREAVERMQTGRQHREVDEYIGEKRLGIQDTSACDHYL